MSSEGNSVRRDPKAMSMAELDEYIQRNKKNDQGDNKSLNSSFQSQPKANWSFNNNNNVQSKFIVENKNYNSEKEDNFQKIGLNYNYLNNINKQISENSIFNNNGESDDSFVKYKYKPPNSHNQIQQDSLSPQINSDASSNYIKSLQDKLTSIYKENEELKRNFIEINEILDKERNAFQIKLLNENAKNQEVETCLRNELLEYENENKQINSELNEYKLKLSLLNTNIGLIENEKQRHLEQNAFEKEDFQNNLNSLTSNLNEKEMQIIGIANENNKLRKRINEVCIQFTFKFS
jgi:hypothetical protein